MAPTALRLLLARTTPPVAAGGGVLARSYSRMPTPARCLVLAVQLGVSKRHFLLHLRDSEQAANSMWLRTG